MKEHGARERIASLALVETGVGPPAQGGIADPVEREQRAFQTADFLAAAADARLAHTDQALSIIGRHAKAAEVNAKAILPALDTIEKARKIYEHELTALREKLAGPVIEASEIQIAEVWSKLARLPQTIRFTRVSQSIDKGSDLLVAAVVGCDAFLSDFLSEAEKSVILEKWQRAKMPEEYARLKVLEADSEHLERTGRLLENWQRSCYNGSISARDVQPAKQRFAVWPTDGDFGLRSWL